MTEPEKPSSGTKPVAGNFPDELEELVRAEESDPFRVLGPHWVERDGKQALAIRAFHPDARELTVVWGDGKNRYPAAQIHPAGVFEAAIPASAIGLAGGEAVAPSAYRLRFRFADGAEFETYDAYAFPPMLTEYDLYLSGEGTHYLKYEKLGAHVREIAGVTRRALRRVGAERDARQRGRRFQFVGRARPPDAQPRAQAASGKCFCPGLAEGALYKFEIRSRVSSELGLEGRSLRLRRRTAAQDRVGGLQHRPLRVERFRVA